MTGTLSKALERILLLVITFVCPVLLFSLYRTIQSETVSEQISERFISEAAASGKISLTEYEQFAKTLASLGGYGFSLEYISYCVEPYYGIYDTAELTEYYMNRNQRKAVEVVSEYPEVDVCNINEMHLQTETNTHIMEHFYGQNISAALPSDDLSGGLTYTAAMPVQEVYVGEKLVTMVIATAYGTTYFNEADVATATIAGTYSMPIKMAGIDSGASIAVTAWDKEVTCSHGHTYPRTKEVINNYKSTGEWGLCPYCKAYAEDIVITPATVSAQLGTDFTALLITVAVKYMDGHVETLASQSLVNDYDFNYSGTQTVKVAFAGAEKEFLVTLAGPACSVCGNAITGESFEDCITVKKCINCIHITPTYLGEYAQYENVYSDTEIRNRIETTGEFKMSRGGYLRVKVEKMTSPNVLKTIFSTNKPAYYTTGGTVKRTGE